MFALIIVCDIAVYLQGDDDNSSSRKCNTSSLKMLLEKEMSKEAESKRRHPSVIARLMGLEEDLPTKEPKLCMIP